MSIGLHHHHHHHGALPPELRRSRAGLRAVAISLALMAATAALQAVVYAFSGSVALLADLIHNFGDALTAFPIAIAFVLRSERAERLSGLFVVGVILISAVVAGYEAIDRLLHPRDIDHLVALALAGLIGVIGNEAAARVRTRAGRKLDSPALVADGDHARADGLVSLGVVASAGAVAIGVPVLDPLIGLANTIAILVISVHSLHVVRAGPTHDHDHDHGDDHEHGRDDGHEHDHGDGLEHGHDHDHDLSEAEPSD